jgi:Fe-S-cluster-containing dehydrogenase component
MALDRRKFFKVLGVTGATLAVGKQSVSGNTAKSNPEFCGVLFDSTRCVGCQTCEVSCAEANGLTAQTDMPEAGTIRKTTDKYRTVVNAWQTETGEVYVKTQCMHCNEPACVAACLTEAMHKTYEGAVTWRGDKCMGCRYCMVSCPFDAPKFEYFSYNPKIEKCTMCYELTQEGKLPACVENCPAEAMMFGPRRELIKEARKRIVENPGQYVDHIYGEHEAGGTGWLYLSGVPFDKIGFNTKIQKKSYPELSKGFLYSVPTIFVLWPAILLGIREGTKSNNANEETNE